jgi:hypothetical protein
MSSLEVAMEDLRSWGRADGGGSQHRLECVRLTHRRSER